MSRTIASARGSRVLRLVGLRLVGLRLVSGTLMLVLVAVLMPRPPLPAKATLLPLKLAVLLNLLRRPVRKSQPNWKTLTWRMRNQRHRRPRRPRSSSLDTLLRLPLLG